MRSIGSFTMNRFATFADAFQRCLLGETGKFFIGLFVCVTLYNVIESDAYGLFFIEIVKGEFAYFVVCSPVIFKCRQIVAHGFSFPIQSQCQCINIGLAYQESLFGYIVCRL